MGSKTNNNIRTNKIALLYFLDILLKMQINVDQILDLVTISVYILITSKTC